MADTGNEQLLVMVDERRTAISPERLEFSERIAAQQCSIVEISRGARTGIETMSQEHALGLQWFDPGVQG